MKKTLYFIALLLLSVLPLGNFAWSQCTNLSAFGSGSAPTSPTAVTFTTCAFAGEYSTMNSAVAGTTYAFTATGGVGNYLTIRQGTPGGTVLAFGFSPLNATVTVSGPVYIHVNTNAACGTDGACHVVSAACPSCAAFNPCASIGTLTCGTPTTTTQSGSGAWSPGNCGFSTPGQEKLYTFTPTTTGVHSLQVTSTNSGGFIDYFFKAASGGCNATGWTCIDDVFSPVTAPIGTLTAGVQYYILLDPETTASITQTFQINCPAPGPANDNCANATPIACGGTASGSTSLATVDGPATSCTGLSVGPDVWYSIVGTGDAITASMCTGTTYDSKIDVYTGTCGALTSVGCNDDFCSTQSQVTWNSTIGVTYRIRVHGFNGASGTFGLAVTCCTNPTTPTVSATTNANCSTTLSVTAGALGSATNWVWYAGGCGTGTSVGSGTSITVSPASTTTYFVRGEGGCTTAANNPCGSSTVTNTPPTVSCPANTSVAVNASCQGTLGSYVGGATASDNCPAGLSAITQSPASGATITGNTVVTLTVSDAQGNTGTCTLTISVNDVTLPNITCPATQTANANANCFAPAANYTSLATVSDNCTLPASPVTQTPTVGTNLSLGANTVTLRVTDGAALTRTCTFTVNVVDVTAPSITCPANVTTSNAPNQCGAVATYGAISATDNCTAPSLTLIGGLASGSFFPVGTTTVTYRAADPVGNSSTCTFTVRVNDTQAPVITCPANIVLPNTLNQCGRIVNFANATATDNCSGVTVANISNPSGTFFPVGVSSSIFRATDGAGNSTTCSFSVTINDVQAPTINCGPSVNVGTDLGACSATNVVLGGPTAFNDNCAIALITNNKPSVFPLGSTTITYIVTDPAGNTGTCTQTVTVKDNQVPVLSCPGNIIVTSTSSDCSASVNFNVSATDNCGSVFIESNYSSGTTFDGGETLVEVLAYDEAGNQVECSFWVSVQNGAEICDDIDNDCDGLVDEADHFVQVLKQIDNASGQFDQYGNAVAIDENTAIAGVKLDDEKGLNAGAAYILTRGSGWSQVKKLYASDAAADDQFGNAVALKGDYALVAANLRDDNGINTGAVYVFQRNAGGAGNWGQIGKLVASDAASNANFGASVAFNGQYAVVGANLDDQAASNAGAAYVFDRNAAWAQVGKLVAADAAADDNYGTSVGISLQDNVVVGANQDDDNGSNAGSAYLYGRNQGGTNTWGLIKKLVASDGAANDNFGVSVDAYGPSVIVGANKNDSRSNNGGVAYIFDKNYGGLGTWNQASRLFAYDSEAGDQLGYSVALDGDYAAVGARYENAKGSGSGSIYTYLRQPDGVWIFLQKIVDPTGNLDDNMTTSLDISGRTIITGAPRDDNGTTADQGSVQIYEDDCADGFQAPGEGVEEKGQQIGINHAAGLRTFPQPFSDVLNIEITVATPGDARITLVNMLGQQVAEIWNGQLTGTNVLQFNPKGLQSGTYYLRVDASDIHEVRPVVLAKN